MELWRKYRPTEFKDMVGQKEAKAVMTSFLRERSLPHALLFTGPSGCGKTTAVRILAKAVGCDELMGYREINCGGKGGIDTVRNIAESISALPMRGKCKFYVLDEAHEMTKPAQEAMLKVAEECPTHAYIVLCTTDPKDLIRTIMTRFTEIKMSALAEDELKTVVTRVLGKETKTREAPVTEEVIDRITEAAEGSARMAVNILGKVLKLKSADEMLEAIQNTEAKRTAFDLGKALLGWDNKRPTWSRVAELLAAIKDQEEPERVRRLMLSLISGVMLKGGKQAVRAAAMFEAFRDNYYDTGFAGLVASCHVCCYGN